MSDFQKPPVKWRAKGSLRFLAHELGVTQKQAARYWDMGWVPGRYRTSKRHRRIRYTDETVAHTRKVVDYAKATNRYVRYHLKHIDYSGIPIPAEDCTSMGALYQRAMECGLDEEQAAHLAYSPHPEEPLSSEDLWFELLHTYTKVLLQDAYAKQLPLASETIQALIETPDDLAFRRVAREAWARFLQNNVLMDDNSFEAFARRRGKWALKEYPRVVIEKPNQRRIF